MLKDRLHNARIRAGLTLDDVAKSVGVSKQTIQRYESGIINNIPSDNIEKIASTLGTTPADLMGWNTNNPEEDVPLVMSLKAGTPEYALMRAFLRHSEPVRKEMASRAEIIDEIFTQNVRRLLKESGDINGFMQKTGLSFDTVGKFMQGETVLTDPDESERIAKYFNLDVVDMFYGAPNLPAENETDHTDTDSDSDLDQKYVSLEMVHDIEMKQINKLFDRSYRSIPDNSASHDFLEALEQYVKNESTPSYEKAKIAIRFIKGKDFDKWLYNFLVKLKSKEPDKFQKEDVLLFLAGELYKSPVLFQIEFKRNVYAVHNFRVLKYNKNTK